MFIRRPNPRALPGMPRCRIRTRNTAQSRLGRERRPHCQVLCSGLPGGDEPRGGVPVMRTKRLPFGMPPSDPRSHLGGGPRGAGMSATHG